jgi:hypothetical protein
MVETELDNDHINIQKGNDITLILLNTVKVNTRIKTQKVFTTTSKVVVDNFSNSNLHKKGLVSHYH